MPEEIFVVFCEDSALRSYEFPTLETAINFAESFSKCLDFEYVEVFNDNDDEYENCLFRIPAKE